MHFDDPMIQNQAANIITCLIYGFLLFSMTSKHLLRIRLVTHTIYVGCGGYVLIIPMFGKSILFVSMYALLMLLSSSAQGMFTEKK
jgi:hypothetical protein